MPTVEENGKTLAEFGLSRNQAVIYLTAVRLGLASFNEISRNSKIRREEVYRSIPALEKVGLIERVLGNPIKVRATPVEEALPILINRFREDYNRKVVALENITIDFIKNQKLNDVIPIVESGGNHLTIISQWNAVNHRGVTMVSESQKEVNLITSIYNADFSAEGHGASFIGQWSAITNSWLNAKKIDPSFFVAK